MIRPPSSPKHARDCTVYTARIGHYAIGPQDGSSSWHVGTRDRRECRSCGRAGVRVSEDAGLRERIDRFGPVTFGPGCGPYDHPIGCQCPYPVEAAERDRLAALRSEDAGPPFDADKMTHAWAILCAEVVSRDGAIVPNPDQWEPDRYNAAAFVGALLDKYAALRSEDAAPLRGTPDEACIGDPEHQYHSHDDEPDPDEDAAPQPDRPSATWRPADRTVLAAMAPIVDGLCSGCGTKPSRETGSCRCLFRIDDVIRGADR